MIDDLIFEHYHGPVDIAAYLNGVRWSDHFRFAERVMAGWPEWKRNLLGDLRA